MRNRRLSLIFAGLVLLAGAVLALTLRGSSQSPTLLSVLVAPAGATVKLDGKGIRAGDIKVAAGQHKLSAEKNGFASQTKDFTATAHQTTFAGLILAPSSAATANWYQNHPKDAELAQKVSNQLFDQAGKSAVSANPLLNKLPYIGAGEHFQIDFGVPSAASKTGQPAIYIRYDSEGAKADALAWIKSQGADASKLDIVYISLPASR